MSPSRHSRGRSHWPFAILLGVGVLVAFVLGRGLGERQRSADATVESPTRPAGTAAGDVSAETSRRSSAAVTVIVYRDDGFRHPAYVVGDERWLLVSTGALRGARGIALETPAGPRPVPYLLAVDFEAGLALFDAGLSRGPKLELGAGPGSLYLGREVEHVTARARLRGFVNSPATERGAGRFVYAVEIPGAARTYFSALVAPGTNRLVGAVVTPARGADPYYAVDAAAVEGLWASVGGAPLARTSELATFLATDSGAQLARFRVATGTNDWQGVRQIGNQLLAAGGTPAEGVRDAMARAYASLVRQSLRSGDVGGAVELVAEAETSLAGDDMLAVLRAEVAYAEGRLADAVIILASALYASADPGTLQLRLREMAVQGARNDALDAEARLAMLRDVVQADPDFAPYYVEQGGLQLALGRYGQALDSFHAAIGIDPSLEPRLRDVMFTAGQRQSTPSRTVARVHSTGSILYVDAAVNGVTGRYILDTGASYTVVSRRMAEASGVAPRGGTQVVTLTTANGRITAPLATAASVSVDQALVNDVPVVILDDMGSFDGLLGLSYLKHFSYTVDAVTGELLLERR